MLPRSVVPALILLAVAWPVAAQDSATAAPPTDSQPAPKKKGMFGKLKSIAGNKTVQTVAKVAACTMVPGGQFVAAGIDAAGNAADGNVAGAATGAAGAATGSACAGAIGGIGGAAAGGAPVPGMGAGMGSIPGVAGSAATIAGAMTAGSGLPDDGTGGQPAQLSAKDEKKMRSMLKKQGMSEDQINSTMAMYKQQGQPQVPSMPDAGSYAAGQPGAPPVAAVAAQPVGLPEDYDAQLKAGKLVLIDLPWKGSSAELIAGTEDGVRITFVKIVESLNLTQGTYRVDVYVTEVDKGVAQARASAIVLFLTKAGLPAEEKLGGKSMAAAKSKQARVELVRN